MKEQLTTKTFPRVGDQCYLRRFTGNYYCDLVKDPYTVIEVTPSKIKIQSCELIAPIYHCTGNPMCDRPDLEGQRVFFFDTVAESIAPDPEGEIIELTWHKKRNLWGTLGTDSDYPRYAIIGEYKHQPYLD